MLTQALCFCLPHLFNLSLIALFFLLAYLAYRLWLFSFRRLAKEGLFRSVVERIRLPVLLFFYESALFFSLSLWEDQKESLPLVFQLLALVAIVTVGWMVLRALRTLFTQTATLYAQDEKKKSSVIQLLFLYRIIVIGVIVLLLGAILLLFPTAKSVGVGLLGSAGVVGVVVGMAARPIFLNLMAGFQIAMTKTINLEDGVIVEGDFGRIESIHLTHVVVRTWDLRRHVIPISQFIDKPFQNADLVSKEKLGEVFLYCDHAVPVDALRTHFHELLSQSPHYNGHVHKLHVVEMEERCLKIRLLATADDVASAFELRCYLREKMVAFLQTHYPQTLPFTRELQLSQEEA